MQPIKSSKWSVIRIALTNKQAKLLLQKFGANGEKLLSQVILIVFSPVLLTFAMGQQRRHLNLCTKIC
jgi:hypothetical protein